MKEVRMKKIEDLLENLTEFSNKGIVGWNALGNLENGGHRDGVEAGRWIDSKEGCWRKLEILLFIGINANDWINQVEKYFQLRFFYSLELMPYIDTPMEMHGSWALTSQLDEETKKMAWATEEGWGTQLEFQKFDHCFDLMDQVPTRLKLLLS